jgi:hypothetical protein
MISDSGFAQLRPLVDKELPKRSEMYHASADRASRLLHLASDKHVKEYLAHPTAYMQAVYAFIDTQVQA